MIEIPDGTSRNAFRWGVRTGPVPLVLALAALLVGCGKKDEMVYPSTNLGGRVYLDAAPINDGMIAFGSMDPKVGAVIVTKILRGRYIAEKVPLGPVRVYISSFKDVGRGKPKVSIIPPRYQIGIDLEVTRNSSQVDFRLVTDEEADAAAAATADRARSGTESEAGSDVAAGADVDTASVPKSAGAEPEPEPGPKSASDTPPAEAETPGATAPAAPEPNWG